MSTALWRAQIPAPRPPIFIDGLTSPTVRNGHISLLHTDWVYPQAQVCPTMVVGMTDGIAPPMASLS